MTNLKEMKRCNALDSDGKRCRKLSAIEVDYHGDGEIYRNGASHEVRWVRVNLCPDHAIATGYTFGV